MRVDDYEDVEKGLFNEEDDEDGVDTGDGGFPDDNTTSYADDEDSDE